MALLRLTDDAVFDPDGDDGVILDTRRGVYFGLNPTATLMLHAALRVDTVEGAVDELRDLVDADPQTLHAGLEALTVQLTEHRLVAR